MPEIKIPPKVATTIPNQVDVANVPPQDDDEMPIDAPGAMSAEAMARAKDQANFPATPAPTSKFDKLEAKAVDAIKKAIKEQIYQDRNIEAGDFALGDKAGLKLQLKFQPVEVSDGLVQGDRHRRSVSERMAKEGPVTWLALGGGIYPHAAISTSIPVGSGFNVSAGFSAGASLAYSVLAPYALELDSLKQAGRNLTVDLPLDSVRARKMPEGATVTIGGQGQVAGNVGASYGVDLQKLGEFATVNANAGISVGVSKQAGLEVTAKKLDGDKIMVQISQSEGTSKNLSDSIHVGLDAHLNNGLPQLENKLLRIGEKEATKALDKEIEKYTSIDLRGVYSSSDSKKATRAFVFDLSNPEAQKAYDAFVGLDLRRAQIDTSDPTSGVSLMTYNQDASRDSAAHQWRAFTVNLMRTMSSTDVENQNLHTDTGDVTISRAVLDKEYDGLFTSHFLGNRSTTRELVSVSKTDEQDQVFYHLRNATQQDADTTVDDVRKFLSLSKLLGAQPGKMPAGYDTPEFAKKFENSTRVVDAYVTDEGLRKLAETDPKEVIERYGKIATDLNRPEIVKPNEYARTWSTIPWAAKDEKEYKWVMQCLSVYGGADGPSQEILRGRYAQVTGGWDIVKDINTYNEGYRITELVKQLKDAKTPRERAEIFAAAKDEQKLDFEAELGTIAAIAGPEAVVVHELSLVDNDNKDRNLTFVSEGQLTDPRPGIQQTLNDS